VVVEQKQESKSVPVKTEDNPPKGLLARATGKIEELQVKAATQVAKAELSLEQGSGKAATYIADNVPQGIANMASRVGSAANVVVSTGKSVRNFALDHVHHAEQAVDSSVGCGIESIGRSLEAICPTVILKKIEEINKKDDLHPELAGPVILGAALNGVDKIEKTMDRYHADLVVTTAASAVGYFRGAQHALHTLHDDDTLLQSAKTAQATAKNEDDDRDIRSATIPDTEGRYYEIDTDGDGNCLFYSIILDALLPTVNDQVRFNAIYQQLFGDQPAGANEALRQSLSHYDGTIKYLIQSNPSLSRLVYHAMRPRIVACLRERRAEFEQYFAQAAEISVDKETFEQHLDRLLRPGYWGGEHELRALSHLLQCRIIVYRYNDAGNLVPVQAGAYGDEYAVENTIRLVHVEQRYVMRANATACVKRNHYHFLLSERQLPQGIHLLHTEQGQAAPHTEAIPSAAKASPSMTASGSGLFERHPSQPARSHVEEAANREEAACKKTA